jgi:glyoxylase-like metal-dependent hydrolase (beta-lactamase superfamily II)
MELVAIGSHAYACIQPDTGFGASNSGLVASGGGLVVDTLYDLGHTRRMMDLYATVRPDVARRVVNTHHNGDHCWGNQLFAEAGAEIIGHRLCADYFGKDSKPEVFVALAAAEDPPAPFAQLAQDLRDYDFHGITLTPPTTLIDTETDIDLDGLHARLIPVGPAHTPGDVVVHLPDEGILFTGDILFHQCTPIGWEGTFANWIGALRRLEALEPDVVVPGHGPLADVVGLAAMREYLEYVEAEASAAYDAGLTPMEAAARIELGPYAAWTQPERIMFQIDRAYRERQGVAWDAPLDVTRLFSEMAEWRALHAQPTPGGRPCAWA